MATFRELHAAARAHQRPKFDAPRTRVICAAICFVLVNINAALAAGCSHPKSAEGGAGLCSSGFGCAVGAPVATLGGFNAYQGATMIDDAFQGRSSDGTNIVRDAFVDYSPKWGQFAYDTVDLAAGVGSLFPRVLMKVDPAVAGINRTKSMFGVKVRNMDNSRAILGKVYDSNVHRGLLGASLLNKGYIAARDFPDD
jgi:filamentous hemagglutinin